MKKIVITLCVMAFYLSPLFAQTANYPFPQNVAYPYGHSQSTILSAKAQSWYNSWKNESLKPCSGKGIMPTADDANTVKVEDLGWAMIATAYMGEKENFDGIYQFYNANTNSRAGGMMVWKVSCENIPNDQGSATDGDLDVAFGLIVASWQWGGDYLEEAKKVIEKCEQLIITCNNGGSNGGPILSLAGGYSSGGAYGGKCDGYTDISYYTPAFFRIFAEVSGNTKWAQLADDAYTHLERNAHTTTGLISNWQNVKTGAPNVGPSGNVGNDAIYSHDASRVAWRMSLDYLWNGNTRAKAWLTKVTNWVVNDLGVDNLKENHNIDGTIANSNNTAAGMAFLGSFAAGSLANDNASVRTALLDKIKNRNDSYWYHRHTGNMYLLALTGNMWNKALISGSSSSTSESSSSIGGSSSSSSESSEIVPILNKTPLTHFSVRISGKALLIEANSPTVVEIYDLKGNKATAFNAFGGSQAVNLSLPNGVYFAKARGMQSIRFVLK